MTRYSAAAAAALLILAGCTPSSPEDPETPTEPVPPPTESALPTDEWEIEETPRSNVGVQLFMFPWESVAEQCTNVLGPAGYGWVLVSPPQEHIEGPEWWVHYQAVSYQVESRLGTREQFAAMTAACKEAGVKVMADAVVNHMTGMESGTGWAGTEFTHYHYPGLYESDDFHHCGLTPNDDISDYKDAQQVQTCELVNLADLDTSSDYVQGRIRGYIADLVMLGVDAVRIDAAKHMAPSDVGGLTSGLPRDLWVVQEVIRSAGEPITPEQYLGNGAVFEFSYGRDIPGIVAGSSWSVFEKMGTGTKYVPSIAAVPFVTNHDTERNGTTLTYKDGEKYMLATVLMILQGYGSPMVYSGYSFSKRDTGPPLDGEGRVQPVTCVDRWETSGDGEYVCAHTWPLVNAAVRFAAVADDAQMKVLRAENDVIALQRGRAVALVNRGAEPADIAVDTGLKAGTYCDLAAEGDCESTVPVTVNGALSVTVPPKGAVILTELDRAELE